MKQRAIAALVSGVSSLRAWPVRSSEVRLDTVVGSGVEAYVRTRDALLAWDIHREAGLLVSAEEPAKLASDLVLGFRFGPIVLRAPLTITALQSGDRLTLMTYRTRPGHPERGVETFGVRLDENNVVHFTIQATSEPARWYTRLGRPVAAWAQAAITVRYLQAAARHGAP